MSAELENTKYMRDLRRVIAQHFDLEELKVVAFDLSIDWDTLRGETILTKIQNLIMFLARRGRLNELVTILGEERPNITFPQLPSSDQQIEDEKLVTPNPLLSYIEKMRGASSLGMIDTISASIYTDEILSELRQAEFPGFTTGKLIIVIKFISQHKLSEHLKPDLSFFNLRDVDLQQVDLQKANLVETRLQWANLYGANLQQATMRRANLQEANLGEANLSNTDLRQANLQGADLSEANLGEANLYSANLSRASLRGANLSRANLGGANLNGAYLVGANLSEAHLLSARYDGDTAWPEGFDPRSANAKFYDG